MPGMYLFDSIRLYSILFYSILFYSVLFIFWSIQFHFILFTSLFIHTYFSQGGPGTGAEAGAAGGTGPVPLGAAQHTGGLVLREARPARRYNAPGVPEGPPPPSPPSCPARPAATPPPPPPLPSPPRRRRCRPLRCAQPRSAPGRRPPSPGCAEAARLARASYVTPAQAGGAPGFAGRPRCPLHGAP